jgi:hypothetical protein
MPAALTPVAPAEVLNPVGVHLDTAVVEEDGKRQSGPIGVVFPWPVVTDGVSCTGLSPARAPPARQPRRRRARPRSHSARPRRRAPRPAGDRPRSRAPAQPGPGHRSPRPAPGRHSTLRPATGPARPHARQPLPTGRMPRPRWPRRGHLGRANVDHDGRDHDARLAEVEGGVGALQDHAHWGRVAARGVERIAGEVRIGEQDVDRGGEHRHSSNEAIRSALEHPNDDPAAAILLGCIRKRPRWTAVVTPVAGRRCRAPSTACAVQREHERCRSNA